MTARQLHFNLFLHDTGHHEASWRLPDADPRAYKKALGLLPVERLSARSRQPKVFERAVIRKYYQ